MVRTVSVVLAVILGLIGLMNFANTMVTSIIVRSRELAMLEAVGMFVWRFTLTPLAVCLPLILALIVIIPVIAYERLSRRSVIDRLRVE